MNNTLQEFYQGQKQTAFEAAERAHWIAFAPIVFQAARCMRDMGILRAVQDSGKQGMTIPQVAEHCNLSVYGARVLMEAGLGMQLFTLNNGTYHATKTTYYLLDDDMVRVNLDFAADVCYEAMFSLEDAIREGRPAGLKVFGTWPTVYEGLSQLPKKAQTSWFNFDHYYSDTTFADALPLLFADNPSTLLDIGGNTGKFTKRASDFNKDVRITIADLPGQLGMANENFRAWGIEDRVTFHPINLLDTAQKLPKGQDAIWMSQFLCCFSEDEVVSILERCREALSPRGRIFILDTFWDRQPNRAGAFSLQQTSLYFTAIANGNSQMYDSAVFQKLLDRAGISVEQTFDGLGHGLAHTLLQCKV